MEIFHKEKQGISEELFFIIQSSKKKNEISNIMSSFKNKNRILQSYKKKL